MWTDPETGMSWGIPEWLGVKKEKPMDKNQVQKRIEAAEEELRQAKQELEDLNKVPESVDIFYNWEVAVGISGSYIIVRGADIHGNKSDDGKVKGYPITPSEARKMAKVLIEMADYLENKSE